MLSRFLDFLCYNYKRGQILTGYLLAFFIPVMLCKPQPSNTCFAVRKSLLEIAWAICLGKTNLHIILLLLLDYDRLNLGVQREAILQ